MVNPVNKIKTIMLTEYVKLIIKNGTSGKEVNYLKYGLLVLVLSAHWAFIGGIVISLQWPMGHWAGSNIFFWGLLCSYFVFNYLVRKEKIPWVFIDTSKN